MNMVQGKPEILREKPTVVPLASSQIPHEVSRHRTRPPADISNALVTSPFHYSLLSTYGKEHSAFH